MSKTEIWDALATTDPSHTKGFSRAGGFRGTAIKPIWIVRRLTEQFGPCGIGWGMGGPSFQVVSHGDEVMVYCTVSCWHTSRENTFHGVGGDKVVTKRQNGTFADDEAFKKAFTDAVGNAFKFIGVGADVHMGLFDDSKYVAEAKQEFSKDKAPSEMPDAEFAKLANLAKAAETTSQFLCKHYSVDNLRHLNQNQYADAIARLTDKLEKMAKEGTNKTLADELGDEVKF